MKISRNLHKIEYWAEIIFQIPFVDITTVPKRKNTLTVTNVLWIQSPSTGIYKYFRQTNFVIFFKKQAVLENFFDFFCKFLLQKTFLVTKCRVLENKNSQQIFFGENMPAKRGFGKKVIKI